MKGKERLRTCHRLKETKETMQLNGMRDPGTVKGHSWGKNGEISTRTQVE